MHVAVWAVVMEDGEAVTLMELTWFPCPFTLTAVEPDFFESCIDVAVMVSAPDAGAADGAVYSPPLVIDPEPADHATLLLMLPVPVIVAMH